MARQLTIPEVIDKNKLVSNRVWLYALKIYVKDRSGEQVEEINLVKNSEDVTIDDDVYLAIPFDISLSESAMETGRVTLTLQDQLGLVQSRLQAHQGAVGFDVDLMIVSLEQGTTEAVYNPDLKERYSIVSTSASDYAVTMTLGGENPLRYLVPKRMQFKDRCSFPYKSIWCGYTGNKPSCDYTLNGENGCAAHDNAPRFGGFPSLNIRG